MKSILVVDSGARQSGPLALALENIVWCGYGSDPKFTISWAPDGLYALTLVEHHRPDLVLIVEGLKDMSVDEFLSVIQADPNLSASQVAILKADGGEGVVIEHKTRPECVPERLLLLLMADSRTRGE
jgi:CheY-like chemotaxis protein